MFKKAVTLHENSTKTLFALPRTAGLWTTMIMMMMTMMIDFNQIHWFNSSQNAGRNSLDPVQLDCPGKFTREFTRERFGALAEQTGVAPSSTRCKQQRLHVITVTGKLWPFSGPNPPFTPVLTLHFLNRSRVAAFSLGATDNPARRRGNRWFVRSHA